MRFNINAVDLGDIKNPPYRFDDFVSRDFDEGDLIETVCGGYGYIESIRNDFFCHKLTADWTAEEKSEDEFDRNHFYVDPEDSPPRNLTKEFPRRIDYNDIVIVGHGGGQYVGQKGEVVNLYEYTTREGDRVNRLVIHVPGFHQRIFVLERNRHKIEEFVREEVSEFFEVGDLVTVMSTRSKFNGREGHIQWMCDKWLEVKDIKTKLAFRVNAKWCRDEMGNRRVVKN